MKKLILIVIVFVGLQSSNYAQMVGKDWMSIGWEVGIPSNDFISGESYSGGRIEYQRMIKPHLSVGISGSWNSFQEYVPKSTYQKPDGSGAITTDLVRELYSVPLTLTTKYYFNRGGGKKLLPYAGIGLGAQYSAEAIYFNIYGIEDNNWGFVARPELGLLYALSDHTALYFSATYNSASIKSDFFQHDNLNHTVLSIGFSFGQ